MGRSLAESYKTACSRLEAWLPELKQIGSQSDNENVRNICTLIQNTSADWISACGARLAPIVATESDSVGSLLVRREQVGCIKRSAKRDAIVAFGNALGEDGFSQFLKWYDSLDSLLESILQDGMMARGFLWYLTNKVPGAFERRVELNLHDRAVWIELCRITYMYVASRGIRLERSFVSDQIEEILKTLIETAELSPERFPIEDEETHQKHIIELQNTIRDLSQRHQ